MNKIYKSASSIWVWLGPDEFQDAEGVFRYIEKRVEQLQVSHGDNLFESGPEPVLCKRPEYLEDYNEKIWLGIARLFERPYWTRVWVLQELGVARQATMYWGPTHELDWYTMVRFANWMGSFPITPQYFDPRTVINV
jgi:hypothetical protein